jgi:hypothetical protein
MLRLSFDSTSLCQARLTGVGVYAQALAKALMANPELQFSASYRLSRWKKASYIKPVGDIFIRLIQISKCLIKIIS